MPSEVTTNSICVIVRDVLITSNKRGGLSNDVTSTSKMGDPAEWDSLSFVAVFVAIGEAFDLELEDDDAIHFQSIVGIEEFLKEALY